MALPPTCTGAITALSISSLHLDPSRPAITRLFGDFLDGQARGAEALYILGDLFEAWVGADDPSETGAFVAERLKALSDSGVPVAFVHGNRDFRLVEESGQRAGRGTEGRRVGKGGGS